jgi:hypothetical protein
MGVTNIDRLVPFVKEDDLESGLRRSAHRYLKMLKEKGAISSFKTRKNGIQEH